MKEVSIEDVLAIINSMETIEIKEEQLEDDLTEFGIDSITFVKVIVALEEEFDCEIPDEKLLISEMDTVQKIINVLQELYDAQENK